MAAKDATTLEVPGPDGAREVRISSPGRELWPGTGITKLVLAEYFVSVGPWFMPIVGHRPITLQRFPSGIDGEEFFAKNPPRGVPDYAQTVTLTYPSGRKHPQLVLNELAVAVWAVQMNTITLHPWPVSVTGEAGDTDNPDELRIDLDPQPGRDFHDAAVAALELRRCSRTSASPHTPRPPATAGSTCTRGSSRPTSSSTSGTGSSPSPASSSGGCPSWSPPRGGRRSAARRSSSTSTRPTATGPSPRRSARGR